MPALRRWAVWVAGSRHFREPLELSRRGDAAGGVDAAAAGVTEAGLVAAGEAEAGMVLLEGRETRLRCVAAGNPRSANVGGGKFAASGIGTAAAISASVTGAATPGSTNPARNDDDCGRRQPDFQANWVHDGNPSPRANKYTLAA